MSNFCEFYNNISIVCIAIWIDLIKCMKISYMYLGWYGFFGKYSNLIMFI